MNVKIVVRGPDARRVEHVAEISDEADLYAVIGVVLDLYREYYPDAPPFRKTVEIDPTWRAPEIVTVSESFAG